MNNSDLNQLSESFEAINNTNELYQPSSFWEKASTEIHNEIIEMGIENFRSFSTTLNFFVPTYGLPGNYYTEEIINDLNKTISQYVSEKEKPFLSLNEFLSGYNQAFSDYKVLVASDNIAQLPYLHHFTESTFGNPIEQFEFEGKKFSRSSLNYLLGLSFLKKHLKGEYPKTIVEIGGGFGTLGEIFHYSGINHVKYIDIDIPPISFVAYHYLKNVFGKSTKYIIQTDETEINIGDLPQATSLCSWNIEKLKGDIDLFVNFISFQEMEPNIVTNYLYHIDRLNPKWILLRNMREGKNIKKNDQDIGVKIPVQKNDYLNMLPNYSLIDSNVIPYGYKTIDGFHSELLLLKRNL